MRVLHFKFETALSDIEKNGRTGKYKLQEVA